MVECIFKREYVYCQVISRSVDVAFLKGVLVYHVLHILAFQIGISVDFTHVRSIPALLLLRIAF